MVSTWKKSHAISPFAWAARNFVQVGADRRGDDGDAHGGQFTVDAAAAPLGVLLRQPEHQRGGARRDSRSAGPVLRVGQVLGDEVSVPAQQGCRLRRRSADLAPQDCHLVAQHDDPDGEVGVTAADEADELEDAAEHPVEERDDHGRMLAAPQSRRQSAGRRARMAFSAPTRSGWRRCCSGGW